ncbi:MAG: hypothetical protein R3B68_12150 [Phycisphaerales bacterium]
MRDDEKSTGGRGPGGLDVVEGSRGGGEAARGERPWIGVHFTCAGRYIRVFRAGTGDGYLARCPTCAKTMWFRVGTGGTAERFFELTCR